MAILLSSNRLTKSFGVRPLFDDLTFVVESGDRVGLIGPNGAGKSTLLRILAGRVTPDAGTLSSMRGLRVGYLEQVPRLPEDATVESAVMGVAEDEDAIAAARETMARLDLQNAGDPATTLVSKLSGGWQKRVALARELAGRPDVLLLDEPTNHLDVESILWLEEFLRRAEFATVTVTHDRLFLQNVSNRILELDRKNPRGLLDVRGDYTTYLDQKEALLAAQSQAETSLRNKLRRETEWLRRGPKARTTKQQARISRAGELADEVSELQYRNESRSVRLSFGATEKQPKRLIEAKGITKGRGDRPLFSKLDLFLGPGSRIGLLGPNGCGKSTLIRVLLGGEEPDTGTVIRGEKLAVAYFEQNRESLDPRTTLAKTLCPNGEHVRYRGQAIHIRGYLDRFLFQRDQADQEVGKLSGGEQSRLLLARLMLKEANLLVLDEPTNDLDVQTLDVLEDCLVDFDGAVLLVTHDRYFLDHVANEVFAFNPFPESRGEVVRFADLSQWETWHAGLITQRKEKARTTRTEDGGAKKKKKLSYKEQRELDGMEAAIRTAEAKVETLNEAVAQPSNQSNASKLVELTASLAAAQSDVERLYERWAELEKS